MRHSKISWANVLSALDKGVPAIASGVPTSEVAAAGWNVLREDLPLPVCVLRTEALDRNLARLQRFVSASGALLCPHGKTSMSPELFDRQLASGCWGLTLATCHQLQVAREHGVGRVLYANQLLGAAEVRYVCGELRRDPSFEFFCLVDSVAGVRLLANRVAAADPARPLQVLLEAGFVGGRCGVRDLPTAIEVAQAVKDHAPHLALAGVEGFEGLLQYRDAGRRDADVRAFLAFVVEVAEALDERDLFDVPAPVLTAGGSAFYDLVLDALTGAQLSRPSRVVLRSGCYLTHDNGLYERLVDDLQGRAPDADLRFEPALEVWAQVLSAPEPELVILSAGRRDFGQDAGNPSPVAHARLGTEVPRPVQGEWSVVGVSDQHAHVHVPRGHQVQVGDLVALGVSHPCTTFDKWRLLFLVDEQRNVIGAVRTWF